MGKQPNGGTNGNRAPQHTTSNVGAAAIENCDSTSDRRIRRGDAVVSTQFSSLDVVLHQKAMLRALAQALRIRVELYVEGSEEFEAALAQLAELIEELIGRMGREDGGSKWIQ